MRLYQASDTVFDGFTVAATSTSTSDTVDVSTAQQVRLVIVSNGSDIDVELQTTPNEVDFLALESYAAGSTGVQPVVELPGLQIRVVANNSGLADQTITAHLLQARW